MKPIGRILIVDDDPIVGLLLTAILRGHHYDARAIQDPTEAKQTVLDRPPALIILDFDMPKMLGVEVATQLKADPRTKDIPIIFSSAMGDADHRTLAAASGGLAFLEKPYGEALLMETVRAVLGTP